MRNMAVSRFLRIPIAGAGPLFFLSLALVCALWPALGQAELGPAPLLKWDGPSDHAILVDKSAQELYLFRRGDAFRPVYIFNCSTGENRGRKFRRNDRKTPEGVYFFTDHLQGYELPPMYGSRAFPIDYPNPLDKMEGRGGSGIWLHGTNQPLEPRDSKGCVVLENESLEILTPFIRLHETPLLIASELHWISHEKLRQESTELEQMIEGWRSGWERKDLEEVNRLYRPASSSMGMHVNPWKAFNPEGRSGEIRIEVRDLQLFRINGVVLAKFYQACLGPGYRSNGQKRLYLSKDRHGWKIVLEVFEEEEDLATRGKAQTLQPGAEKGISSESIASAIFP